MEQLEAIVLSIFQRCKLILNLKFHKLKAKQQYLPNKADIQSERI